VACTSTCSSLNIDHVAEANVWAGVTTVMVPPQVHWQVEVASTQGMAPMLAETDAGVHGDPVAGMHG
jgi:hypothetical protein